MVEDYEILRSAKVPQLTHVTSFELSCIEDHGKQMAEDYVHYVDNLNLACSPEELEHNVSYVCIQK